VYLQSFPSSEGRWQVSNQGGRWPRWRGDGRELYYISTEGMLTAVEVKTQAGGFSAGSQRPLFRLVTRLDGEEYAYDATADGQRFLALAPEAEAAPRPMEVVLNWPAGVSHR